MQNTIKKLINSDGTRQTFVTVFGNTAATGISAVSIILISRILGPSLFGEFTVGFALAIIVTKMNDLGLSAALHKFIPATSNIKTKKAYFQYSLLIKTITSFGLILLSIFFAPTIQYFLGLENQLVLYSSITLGFVITYYDHLLAVLQSLHLFGRAVIVNGLQALTKLIGAIFFLLLQISSLSPIYIWYIAAPIVPLLMSPFLLPKWFSFTTKKLTDIQKNTFLNMAGHSSITTISNNIVEHTVIVLVQVYLSAYESGLLGGAFRISMLFSLGAISLGNVLYPRVARYSSKRDLLAYFKKAVIISILSLLVYILVAPFSGILLATTVGKQYLPARQILHLLLGAVFIQTATVPFAALFYSLRKTWYFSASGTALLAITIIGNVYFLPIYGLQAAAWSQIVARLFILLFTFALAVTTMNKQKIFDK